MEQKRGWKTKILKMAGKLGQGVGALKKGGGVRALPRPMNCLHENFQ